MPFPFNPQQLQTYDLTQKDQAHVFVQQLAIMMNQLMTPNGLAGILQTAGMIPDSALVTVATSLGSVSTNQTVNCSGATGVTINLSITAAITLNLTFLPASVPVLIRCQNAGGGAFVLKIAGTNAANTAFTSVLAVFASAGAETNMTTTGFNIAAGASQYFHGQSLTTNLFLLSL